MRECVCARTCVYMCQCDCVPACARVWMDGRIHASMGVCVHDFAFQYVGVCVYARICVFVVLFLYLYSYLFINVSINASMHVCIFIYNSTLVHI